MKARVMWYRRSGERVSAKRVAEVHKHAVHAKRYGHPASPWAPPGMSAQPSVADSLARMTDEEWASNSGMFVSVRRES